MKILHHALWIIFIILLQTVLNSIEVFGVHAEAGVVAAALVGFMCGRVQGVVFGAVMGLLYDLTGGRIVGVTMLSLALSGYISAVISDRFYVRTPFYVYMALGAAATVMTELIYLIPYSAACGSVSPLAVLRIIGIELVLNALLILPLTWLMKRSLALLGIKKFSIYR